MLLMIDLTSDFFSSFNIFHSYLFEELFEDCYRGFETWDLIVAFA